MTRLTSSEDSLRRIDSRQNALVKELRRAFAEAAPNQEGEVAIEGMHLVEEAIRSGLRLSTVFFSDSARERAHRLLPQLSSQTETLLLSDSVFASAVPSETPQGVAALVRVKSFDVGRHSCSAAGVAGDCRRPAGSWQSGHHRPFRRGLWRERTSVRRAHGESLELESDSRFGGIAVPAAGD